MKTIKNFTTKIAVFLFLISYGTSVFSAIDPVYSNSGILNEFKIIKGKIVDSKTKKELVFATVSVVGTNIGTVTNTEGEFVLKIKNDLNATEIEISYLGYKNLKKQINIFNDETVIIDLELQAISLSEIVIIPENATDLLNGIRAAIPKNYSIEPNSMMAFYRETIMQRRKYVAISEAVVEVYKAPYDNESKNDLVKLIKGRKSADVKKQDTLLFKLEGGPTVSLILDIIKNPYVILEKEMEQYYKYEILNAISIDNKQNFVIQFTQIAENEMALFNGKLYVDAQTLAVTAAEFSMNLADKEKAASMFIRKKPIGLKLTPLSTNYLVKYKQDNGKFYFSYVRNEVKFQCKWNRRLFNTTYSIMSEMAITDRTNQNVVEFPKSERMRSFTVFADKLNAFNDEDFWGEYNTIEPDQSIESAISKYGKRLKRMEQ